MSEISGLFFIIVFLVGLALAIAAVLMPIVVIIIDGRVRKIQTALESMEHMMRHGK